MTGKLKIDVMKTLRFVTILLCAAFLQNAFPQTELNWNIIYKLTNVHSISIGDVPGHTIGSAEGTGLGFLSDNKPAVMNGSFTYDYVNGSGPYTAYYSLSFDNGSSFIVKCNASAEFIAAENKTVFSGEIIYISGKGIYEGISGKGSIKGKRTQGIESGAAVYLEITSSYEIKK
jgi:hypothetical protein